MCKRSVSFSTMLTMCIFLFLCHDLFAQRAFGALSYRDDSIRVKEEFNDSKARMLYNQGVVATQRGDYRLAIQHFTRASEMLNGFGEALYNRGVANLLMNNPLEAMLDFAEAIQADPKPEYYLSRCLLLLHRKDTTAALSDLQKVLQSKSASAVVLLQAAMLQKAVNDYAGAQSTLKQLLVADTTNANLLNAMAETSLDLGDVPAALEFYRQSLQLAPQQTDVMLAIGQLQYQLQQKDAAQATFRTVLHYLPDHPVALNGIALLYLARDEVDTATTWSDLALDADPRDAAIWNTQGIIAWKKSDYLKAEAAFTMAITHDPALSVAYYNRALVRVMLRNDAGACDDFQLAAQTGLPQAVKGYRESCE
jgi:tetratricopeptide (TPR) repeat protein